jgi:hypothetical protein
LEQERLKLEEVVKMEIRARMGAVEGVREQLGASIASARNDHAALSGTVAALRADHASLQSAHALFERCTETAIQAVKSELGAMQKQVRVSLRFHAQI